MTNGNENEDESIIYTPDQLGKEIIKTHATVSSELKSVIIEDENGNKLTVWRAIPTDYKELITEDLSTAGCPPNDIAVARNEAFVCNIVRQTAKTYKDENGNNLDLTRFHNMVADCHNYLIVSSKASGFGAKTAKSQYAEVHKRTALTAEEKGSKNTGLLDYMMRGRE